MPVMSRHEMGENEEVDNFQFLGIILGPQPIMNGCKESRDFFGFKNLREK